MTTKIGLSGSLATVPDPSKEMTQTDVYIASHQRALDGAALSQYVAAKKSWKVSWKHLTATQLATLLTELRRQAHLVWEPPDSGSYTIYVTEPPTFKQTTATRYELSVSLEQV